MKEALEDKHIYLQKDHTTLRGIILAEEDLFVLKQLYIHYSMESKALHAIYTFLAGGERSKNGITNRLRKLVEAGVLIRKKERILNGGVFIYHYRLGKKGMDALITLKVTTPQEGERILGQAKRLPIPGAHIKATSKLVNEIVLAYTGHPDIPEHEVVHNRGAAHPVFGANTNLNLKGLIIPDWVVERGNLLVCLELDTGSEGVQNKLRSKYKRYVKMAEKLKSEGKELIVIYAVVDKPKRVATIKESIPLFHEWPQNLHLYTVLVERVPELVTRLLTYRDPSSNDEQKLFIDYWTEQLLTHSTSRQPFAQYEIDDFYEPTRDKRMDVQTVVSMPFGNKDKLFGVLYAEEGSVRSHQLIRTNLQRNQTYNESQEDNQINLLVCYENEERLLENINGLTPVSPLLETDFMSWREWNGEKLPTVHKTVTTYKRIKGGIE